MWRGVAAGYRGYSGFSPGEHGDTDVVFCMPSKGEEPFACPIGGTLLRAYRERSGTSTCWAAMIATSFDLCSLTET